MVDIARYIDHTLLKSEATEGDIHRLCEEAIEHRFFAVCVNPFWVPYCERLLEGSDVRLCSVAGFPLGADQVMMKAEVAKRAVEEGAREIDMVMNMGAFKSRQFSVVKNEIEAVRKVTDRQILKVILETCLLSQEEKVIACRLAQEAGADFVKTSTGFSSGGATVGDVALMRETVGSKMGVKASGGIRTLEQVVQMIEAGASRIGSSSGVTIVQKGVKYSLFTF